MDGELIYIIFSFAPCFFFHLHTHTTCIFKLTHNVTLGVCFLFFDIYIYIYIFRLAMWAASGLILQGCTNHMGGVEAITRSLNDNMF